MVSPQASQVQQFSALHFLFAVSFKGSIGYVRVVLAGIPMNIPCLVLLFILPMDISLLSSVLLTTLGSLVRILFSVTASVNSSSLPTGIKACSFGHQ